MYRTVAAALGLAVLLPSVAWAHATLETPEASPDSYYKAVVRIGHGCDGSATNTVRVTVPEGVISVRPMPKAGWDVELQEADYARSYELHGRQYDRGVRTITWTGGLLPDNYYDEFVFRGRLTDFKHGSTVYFPVTQECEEGEIAWSQIPAQGQDAHDLDRPAPGLLILAADGGQHGHQHGHQHGAMSHDAMTGDGTYQVGELTVETPWSRATSARAGGVFMMIHNGGHHGDRLIGAESDLAGRVEVHMTIMEDGVMRMRHMEDGIEVPAGGMAELKPGGFHVMLMGLTQPLAEGESFPLTLIFDEAGEVTVDVPVRAAGAMDAGMHHNH